MLRWAGVIGRFFDLRHAGRGVRRRARTTCSTGSTRPSRPGLVREEGIGSYLFGHALVRDAIYGSFSATRRARAHARVAEVLEGQPRPRERDRPALAGRRPGARRAAPGARPGAPPASPGGCTPTTPPRSCSAAARDSLGQDPDATPQDRYDLLMDLADAHRWRGAWSDLLETVEQAIETADEMGDVRLLAGPSAAMTIGALWQSAGHGDDPRHGRGARCAGRSTGSPPRTTRCAAG